MNDRNVLARRHQFAEQQRRAILDVLNREQLEQRVRALARDGMREYDIAETLRLHIEQVRRVLAEPNQ